MIVDSMTPDQETVDRINAQADEIVADLVLRLSAIQVEHGGKFASAVALDVCARLLAPVLAGLQQDSRLALLQLVCGEALELADLVSQSVAAAVVLPEDC